MNDQDNIVLPEDNQAAYFGEAKGWFSRRGTFFGPREDLAREDGSTHFECSICNRILRKGSYPLCKSCKKAERDKHYATFPREPWYGDVPVYSEDANKYFSDIEGLYNFVADAEDIESTLNSLSLTLCEPQYATLDDQHFLSLVGEDGELPDKITEAIAEFNSAVSDVVISYSPSKKAVCIDHDFLRRLRFARESK